MKHYIIRTIIICAVATPVYLLIRQPWKQEDKCRELLLMVFAVYMTCLAILTLEGDYSTPENMLRTFRERLVTRNSVSLKPFESITSFLDWGSTDDVWVNIISNFVIFLPFGFLIPLLWEKFRKPWVIVLISLVTPVFIEFWQLFINRHTDIDDVILNFAGSVTGALILCIVNKIKNKTHNLNKE